jgi:hypothetical protein
MSVMRIGRSLVVSTMAVLLLSQAVPTWGHGFGRGGFGPRHPGGPHGPDFGGLIERLVFPCRADCLEAARGCFATAVSEAVTCAEQACDAAIQTARSACASGLATEECRDARGALLECAAPCLEAKRSAVGTCRTTVAECRAGCESSGE